MQNKREDIGKAFEKLVDSTFIKIDGCLVKRGVNEHTGQDGFIWGDFWYGSVKEVRDAMNGIYTQISLSIINPNGEVKELGEEYTNCYHKGESGYEKFKKDTSPK